MKMKRQAKIIELVNSLEIETQDELGELLEKSGYPVTQATISRDIHELKLTKVLTEDGKQKYAVIPSVSLEISRRLERIFCDGVVSIDSAGNFVVIKTLEGLAMAVGAALDAMEFSEIIGSIGGDDTLLCVVKTDAVAEKLVHKLRKMLYA